MIIFSHANSYGAGTYRRLFDGFKVAGHEVEAVARFGHDSRYPVGRNWRGMANELIALIDHLGEERVWLVGHSMGGYLSLIAAGQRPLRLNGVVLLDSPILSGWKSGLISVLKASGQMRRFSPAAVSSKRRDRWPSIEQVHQHFSSKPLFAKWHPDVLRDYIDTGTEPDAENVEVTARRLSFRRDVETSIYATLPHWLDAYLHRHPPGALVAFVGGRDSREVRQAGLVAIRRLTQGRLSWVDGSHLFPFERPDETVIEVLNWFARLRSDQQAILK
jgi:pimeloyl-ACP methyl ester carboxylesterase